MAAPTPQQGVEYPIVLGDSLLEGHGNDQFLTLSYNFKPASVCQASHGRLDVQPNSQVRGGDQWERPHASRLPPAAHPT